MADEPAAPKWFIPDTRTIIVCWMMFSSFVIIFLFWLKPPAAADSQLLNTLVGIYFGTGLVTAITWWMGSAKGSDANNKMADANSEVVRKLSTTVGTGNGQPNVPVPPWWSRLNDAEKNAIAAAGPGDPRVAAFITASQVGAATVDDLTYIVSKGLLTQERADAVKGT